MPRGGRRAGAGRKKGSKVITKAEAGEVLGDPRAQWEKLLKSKDENVQLKALIYLTNRRFGMPHQSTSVTAELGLLPEGFQQSLTTGGKLEPQDLDARIAQLERELGYQAQLPADCSPEASLTQDLPVLGVPVCVDRAFIESLPRAPQPEPEIPGPQPEYGTSILPAPKELPEPTNPEWGPVFAKAPHA